MLKFLIITICFLINIPAPWAKEIYINVGMARVKKSKIALPTFNHVGSKANSQTIRVGQNIFSVLYNDLQSSSLFQFIDQAAFLENTQLTSVRPAPLAPRGFKFENWKVIGTEFLVRGSYRILKNNIHLELYLYYVPHGKTLISKTYQSPITAVRKLAHTIANDVVVTLTGKPSFFNTRITVASNRSNAKFKEIWVMDWDGANAKKISNHRSIAISPTWSADGNKVAYTAFAYHKKAKIRNADLFTYELSTGKRWLTSYRKGINSGAAFFPDNKKLLITISQSGNPDIFQMTPDGKNLTRITRGPNGAMNVEPAISPDGKHIAFASDRSGKPMIYIMKSDGTNVRRVTFAGRYNATPSWSPDGKRIAFAGYSDKHFDIFTVNKDGTNITRLTTAKKRNGKLSNNEDPTFSPDGRHIMFVSDRTGNSQLYIVNTDGTNERRITTDRYNYFKPKWGPLPK